LQEISIGTINLRKLFRVARLNEAAAFKNKDLVGTGSGGKAVSDDQGAPALRKLGEHLCKTGFKDRIQ
jgi:hypothetical protein